MTSPPPGPYAFPPGSRYGHPVPRSVEEASAPELLPMTQASLNFALESWLPSCRRTGVTLVPGGWEEWVALDLLGWIHESLGTSPVRRWDVQRGARIHLDADVRVDLLFNAHCHDAVRPMLAVEILAESSLVPRPDFLNRMHREAEQLRARYLIPAYRTARRMLLAVTVDPSTPTLFQRHGFGAVVSTPWGTSAMWRYIDG